MTVRSKSLWRYNGGPTGLPLYTVPAGHVTILKSWQLTRTDAGAAGFWALSLLRGNNCFLEPFSFTMAQWQTLSSDRWTVLQAGDSITVFAGGGAAPTMHTLGSGAELVL